MGHGRHLSSTRNARRSGDEEIVSLLNIRSECVRRSLKRGERVDQRRGFAQLPECSITMTDVSTNENAEKKQRLTATSQHCKHSRLSSDAAHPMTMTLIGNDVKAIDSTLVSLRLE